MKRWTKRLIALAVCGVVLTLAAQAHAGSSPTKLPIRKAAMPTITTLNKSIVIPTATRARFMRQVDWRLLNPQPLPPRWNPPWVRQGLNPQPLPPRR